MFNRKTDKNLFSFSFFFFFLGGGGMFLCLSSYNSIIKLLTIRNKSSSPEDFDLMRFDCN